MTDFDNCLTFSKGFDLFSIMLRLFLLLICLLLSPVVLANGKILVFGDSLSAGYGLQQGEGWVNLLDQRLRSLKLEYEVINASISGDTTDNGLLRLDGTLKTSSPDIVILELGGNDGLRGLSLDAMKNNLSKMIDSCQKINAKVLLVGMKLPPNYGSFFNKKFINVYSELASEKNIPLVPLLFDGFETDLRLFQADKIHPNSDGQILMLNNVWPHLESLLTQ